MKMTHLRRTVVAVAAVAATALPALTACSSSSSSSAASSAGSSAGSSAAGTSSSAAASVGSSPSAGPIKLMWIGALSGPANRAGDVLAGVQAAVKAVNAKGGVKGQQLDLIACDDAFDANKGVACARQAVKEGVVAVVGEDTSTGQATQPVLDAGGIPSVGISASSAAENQSPMVFPLGSGTAGEIYGAALMYGKLGCKKPALAYGDFVAAKFVATAYMMPVLAKQGLPTPKMVAIPASATDLSSYAESLASGGTDCISYIDNADKSQLLAKALYEAHPDIKYLSSGAVWGPKRLKAIGDASKSLYLSFGFANPDQTNVNVKLYNSEMDALGGDQDRNELAQSAWNATHITADLLAKLSTISPASLVAAIKASGAQTFGGAVPQWNWATPVNLVPGAKTFGSYVYFGKVADGKIALLGDSKPYDVLKPESIASLAS